MSRELYKIGYQGKPFNVRPSEEGGGEDTN